MRQGNAGRSPTSWGQKHYTGKPWRGRMETAGGVMINRALHTLGLILYLMDQPVELFRDCIGRMHPAMRALTIFIFEESTPSDFLTHPRYILFCDEPN